MKQEMMGWQWQQPDHTQIICTLLQTFPVSDYPGCPGKEAIKWVLL